MTQDYSRPRRQSNVGIGWDDDDDDGYDDYDDYMPSGPPGRGGRGAAVAPLNNNEGYGDDDDDDRGKGSSSEGGGTGGGFFQRAFARQQEQSSRRAGAEEYDEEEGDGDHYPSETAQAAMTGGATGAAARMSEIGERSSGKQVSPREKRGRNWGRCLAMFMAITIIVGVVVGAYMGKMKNDEEKEQNAKDAQILQDIIDNRTNPPTRVPTQQPTSALPTTQAPTLQPVSSSSSPTESPTLPPVQARPAPVVPDCDDGLVAHKVTLEGADDNSDASLWSSPRSGQIRTLVLQIRDAEWGDLIYQKGFRAPDEYDYTCLNVYDAMQEMSFQSGCYDVSLSWFIPGVGVEMPEEGNVRWRIMPVEVVPPPTAVTLGIVPYSQDRTTTCTIRTAIEEGFFQCLPNCAQAPAPTVEKEAGGGSSISEENGVVDDVVQPVGPPPSSSPTTLAPTLASSLPPTSLDKEVGSNSTEGLEDDGPVTLPSTAPTTRGMNTADNGECGKRNKLHILGFERENVLAGEFQIDKTTKLSITKTSPKGEGSVVYEGMLADIFDSTENGDPVYLCLRTKMCYKALLNGTIPSGMEWHVRPVELGAVPSQGSTIAKGIGGECEFTLPGKAAPVCPYTCS